MFDHGSLVRSACFVLVSSGPVWTGRAMGEDTQTYDTGLVQQLRQQLSSDCYGFVDHDPDQIRGYGVNGAFQLLRDGYPWARFEDSANLLVQRQEALVGGPGLGCAYTAPGGMIDLVSRRDHEALRRAVTEFDHYGSANLRIETPWRMGDRLAGRLAGRFERFRDAAENENRTGDLAANIDLNLTPDTRLRVDAEWRRADRSSGVGWPAFEDLPKRIDRTTSLTQPWAHYRFDSLATLVALKHASSPETLWRAGMTRVRYRADWHDLYLDPTDGNAFTLVDFVYPDQAYRFDAWHADVTHRGWTGEVAHTLRAEFSRLRAEEPDQVRPGQVVGAWGQGAVLPSVDALPASVTGTGEADLDGKQPPGRRCTSNSGWAPKAPGPSASPPRACPGARPSTTTPCSHRVICAGISGCNGCTASARCRVRCFSRCRTSPTPSPGAMSGAGSPMPCRFERSASRCPWSGEAIPYGRIASGAAPAEVNPTRIHKFRRLTVYPGHQIITILIYKNEPQCLTF
jgi:hypothetical protein